MRDFEVPQETTQRLADVQAPVLNVVMHVECYPRACTVNLENRAEETIPWSLGHTYRHSIRELHRQAHWGGEGQTGRRRRAQLPLTSAWRISSSHFTSRPALVPLALGRVLYKGSTVCITAAVVRPTWHRVHTPQIWACKGRTSSLQGDSRRFATHSLNTTELCT